jgi:hypothetical protein
VSLIESLDGRTDLGKMGFYSLLVDDGGGGGDGDDGDDADLRWQSGTGRDTEDKAVQPFKRIVRELPRWCFGRFQNELSWRKPI